MSSFPVTPSKLLSSLSEHPVPEEDESNWAQFVEMYEPVIRAFLSVEGTGENDLDDAVQDVFMRLVRIMRREGYDSSRGRFRSYLRTIMRRVLVDRFRRQEADRASLHVPFAEYGTSSGDDMQECDVSAMPDPAAMFEARWRKAQFDALLNHVFTQTAISDQSRGIYRAHVLNGEDARAVAKRFGVSPEVVRQVKSRINRMLAALARRLEGE